MAEYSATAAGTEDLLAEIEQTGEHFFICGRAGTGKSSTLRLLRHSTRKRCVVLAPTGVAALNVEGQTIHSFFHFPPRFIDKTVIRRRYSPVLHSLELLIIDEISMVRADVMDGIDYALRQARRNNQPFGGVQMIMFGDLFQLPPVVRSPELNDFFSQHYGGAFFFQAHIFTQCPLRVYELTTVYRQQDQQFIKLLEQIRDNSLSAEALELLNTRVTPAAALPRQAVVVLTTTNALARQINETRLADFAAPEYHYRAQVTDSFESGFFPTDADLVLKQGAQVMLLQNDPDKRWVNGSLATISKLTADSVTVFFDGQEYPVRKARWERVEYRYDEDAATIKEDMVGCFEQYPLRLAWAMTIHKSQGNTFEHLIINLGAGAFAHGQVYVALSRCRSLAGIYLTRPVRPADIMFEPAVYEFQSRLRALRRQ